MRLERLATEMLIRAGVSPRHAETVARSLVHADLRAIHSHGMARLAVYLKRVEQGLIDLDQEPSIHKQAGATAIVNGKNHLGAVVGEAALQTALELAEQYGIGVVGVAASNHFGACSYYAEQAVEKGYILILMSNAPKSMAPTGGVRPFFGSNPIAAGIPTGVEPPFLLDMATAVAARGKIALAAQKGEAIPQGWAIDERGRDTTDPVQALRGALLPIAGAKGYGLSMLVDILCGLLTGAGYGPDVHSLYENDFFPQNVGHLFLTLRIENFMPLALFQQQMDTYIRQIKAEPKMEGQDEILIPGEKEWRTAAERRTNGIPLPDEIALELETICAKYQLTLEEARIQ
ncbi:Ldh family oxidoreductase [Brevibacillus ruminantium]|uniref:Ldh family oxidoreductase n=2 Tax=Brevibacillus ruminantium TaxID=2950604 RepID=A0ABY4WQQ5_9BACL|nr:Ldh family oxidoreductase [Brevibacillus ruminantium]